MEIRSVHIMMPRVRQNNELAYSLAFDEELPEVS